MTAIHLLSKEHVGTTYKRALERFHLSRDAAIPRDINALRLIDTPDNWFVLNEQREDIAMRKPRDFDTELKALGDKAKQLRDRKLIQLGELVIASGADVLPIEQLAGALLAAVDTKDATIKEGWRKRGAAFFQRSPRGTGSADRNAGGSAADDSRTKPATVAPGA
jgi:hypothetical protein